VINFHAVAAAAGKDQCRQHRDGAGGGDLFHLLVPVKYPIKAKAAKPSLAFAHQKLSHRLQKMNSKKWF
jgi:hypothetical protein